MATLLLVVIYIAFVGLGIPDSLFGAAWPAIYPELSLPLSSATAFLLTVNVCTIVASLASARVIRLLGTAWVTVVSTLLTAVAMLGFSVAGGLVWLCLLGIPLGLGAGCIDAALNNYVALHYKATHMSFLHCAYGVGVTLSPYLLSIMFEDGGGWRGGYRTAAMIQLGATAVTVAALPLWRRAHPVPAAVPEEERPRVLSLREVARLPGIRAVWLVFVTSCGIECLCGAWGATYLVEGKGVAVDTAAELLMYYYIGMTLGRFLSGVFAARLSGWRIIRISMAVLFAAAVLLLLPLPAAVSGAGLFLVGLGNGPIFPNMTHLTPSNFGRDVSQSVIGTQMAAAYIGVTVVSPVFGPLARLVGVWLFPWYLAATFALMCVAAVLMFRHAARRGVL